MAESIPPLRVREQDGAPNIIPVFDIIVSNGTVSQVRPGVITLGMGTGAAGAPGASGGMAIGSGVTGGSAGAVLFVDSNQQLAQDVSQFFWDNANNRVGIGGSTPAMALDVTGSGRTTSVFVLGAQASSAGHALRADRLITTLYPITGGGLDFTADRTFSIDTAFLVNSGRIITTLYPLTGGGLNFSADRTFSVDTAFLVTSTRTVTAGVGITGGGNLGADVTVNLLTGGAGQYVITSAGATEGIAWINTAGAGGGPVYAPTGGNYITFAPDANLTAEQVLIAGTGITVASDGTNFFISINTDVRDKTAGFFAGGNLSTTHIAEESKVRIPFNMQAIRVDLAVTTSAGGSAIIVDLNQYNRLVLAGTSMFTSTANQPQIPAGFNAGSATSFDAIGTLYAGSFLGFDIDQVGSTVAGSNLTITVVVRSS